MAFKNAKPTNIVTLADLAPRRPVVGGSKRVFGATPHADEDKTMATKKDLPAKKTVKGGRVVSNDNLTLVRAGKPAKKDLPAKKTVKGGRVVYNDNLTLVRAAKPAKKDLPAKKTVKAGKVVANDNLTLVRGAKPAKKDLPSKKTVKGGFKYNR